MGLACLKKEWVCLRLNQCRSDSDFVSCSWKGTEETKNLRQLRRNECALCLAKSLRTLAQTLGLERAQEDQTLRHSTQCPGGSKHAKQPRLSAPPCRCATLRPPRLVPPRACPQSPLRLQQCLQKTRNICGGCAAVNCSRECEEEQADPAVRRAATQLEPRRAGAR